MQTTIPAAKPRREHTVPPRALSTTAAAEYLGVSASLLRKYRLRGPDDPGVAGPSFIKVGAGLVLYEIAELDRWLDSHRRSVA